MEIVRRKDSGAYIARKITGNSDPGVQLLGHFVLKHFDRPAMIELLKNLSRREDVHGGSAKHALERELSELSDIG